MKIIVKDQRVLPVADAETYVGGEDNLNRLVNNNWVLALPGKSKGMEFDIKVAGVQIPHPALSITHDSIPVGVTTEPKTLDLHAVICAKNLVPKSSSLVWRMRSHVLKKSAAEGSRTPNLLIRSQESHRWNVPIFLCHPIFL